MPRVRNMMAGVVAAAGTTVLGIAIYVARAENADKVEREELRAVVNEIRYERRAEMTEVKKDLKGEIQQVQKTVTRLEDKIDRLTEILMTHDRNGEIP